MFLVFGAEIGAISTVQGFVHVFFIRARVPGW